MASGEDCKHIKEVKRMKADEKAKKAKKAKPKTRQPQARLTVAANRDLAVLARQLFDDYPEEHKALGITRPSRKIAIDYMRVRCTRNTIYRMDVQTPENNMFLKIAGDKEEI